MFRTFLSQLLRNPVYAQADLELYEFFKSQGAAIVNDASDFAGTNGCYLYQGRDVKEEMSASWGAITSIWSFKHLSLSSFTSRP